jgi:hypothetical protein
MSINLRKIEIEEGKGRLRHGVYAYLDKGKLPSGRAWKRIQEEISRLRKELIDQYGGPEKIQPAVLCLLESAIEGLTIQKLSTLYVKKAGILRRDSLKDGDLSLHSVLSGQFISYANLVRLNLEAAARLADRKPQGEVIEDVLAYVARTYPEDRPQEAQDAEKRATSPVEARPPVDSTEGTDNSDDAPGGDSKASEA